MDRKDTIAFSAGEAVQTNVVTHVTDPWPPHARQKDIAFSGERIARTVRRYECGPRGGNNSGAQGGGFGSPTININNGPAAAATSAEPC
ncbi:hypothetical protein DC522_04920 [Microvirga sp. KLBC 81]|nr:hypothetical protein DC522_04920 [Microvirga sp. KLBC 81]